MKNLYSLLKDMTGIGVLNGDLPSRQEVDVLTKAALLVSKGNFGRETYFDLNSLGVSPGYVFENRLALVSEGGLGGTVSVGEVNTHGAVLNKWQMSPVANAFAEKILGAAEDFYQESSINEELTASKLSVSETTTAAKLLANAAASGFRHYISADGKPMIRAGAFAIEPKARMGGILGAEKVTLLDGVGGEQTVELKTTLAKEFVRMVRDTGKAYLEQNRHMNQTAKGSEFSL